MAKKKTTETKETTKKTLDPNTIDKELKKEFGDSIFMSGSTIVENKLQIIPVSPKIDYMLGGGIQEGSFCIVTGPPKVGKTSMCLDFAGTAQQPQYAPTRFPDILRHVYFLDIEGRLLGRDLSGIPLLNQANFTRIGNTPEKLLTAEDYLSILEKLVYTKPGAIFIIDSISQLCTQAYKDKDIGEKSRNNIHVMLSELTKRIAGITKINQSIIFAVTHRHANTGGGQKKWAESGGTKIQYTVDVKLKATYCTGIMQNDEQIGQTVFWECDCSPIGPPGRKAESRFIYNIGIDKFGETIELAKDLGIIMVAKGGGWHTLPEDIKIQGIEKVFIYLEENPDAYAEIQTQIGTMLGL